MWYVLDVRPEMTVWPLEPAWSNPPYQGFGRPRKPKLLSGERLTVERRSLSLPEEAWQEVTVEEGTQGPRNYMFSAQRVRVTRKRKPGEVVWTVYRHNVDGSEARYYLSNAPEDTPLKMLAYVGGSRWRIETEFETEKSDVGLDEYETRTWAGLESPYCSVPGGRGFPAEFAAGMGGKRCPGSPGPKFTGWCGRCCPGRGSGRMSCCAGWRVSKSATNGRDSLTRNAAPPAEHRQASLPKAVIVILGGWDIRGDTPKNWYIISNS